MMAFSRVAYVCQCPTRVSDPPTLDADLAVRRGDEADLARLPEELLPPGRLERLRARLRAGEIFVFGEHEGRVVSCTWLRRTGTFALHGLSDCLFRLAENAGYGYDAWTDPALRGRGLRRAVFAEELRILASLGAAWEVSYFVDHQLDGGRRNLAKIGVPLVPLWKITALPGGRAALTPLAERCAATPCFDAVCEEVIPHDHR